MTDERSHVLASRAVETMDTAQDDVEPFRRLADAIPHVFWITQLDPERVIYVSPSFEQIWGRTPQELYDDARVWVACIHPDDRHKVEAEFNRWLTGTDRTCRKLEYRIVQPSGALRWVTDHGVVTYDSSGKAVRVSGVSTDITDLKLAEREHLSHVRFLASLDRVNQAIQSSNELEPMLGAVLGEVREIFDCDRAWLASDECEGWRLLHERAAPAYRSDGSSPDYAAAPGIAELFGSVVDGSGVARFGAGSPFALPSAIARDHGVRAMICTALPSKVGNSKVGNAFVLGLHQCERPLAFTEKDEQLFLEIGRRLADALGTLWSFRRLRESEARLEAAQRQAHLGYWSLDLSTRLVTSSAETFRICGVTPREQAIPASAFRELLHPDDLPRVDEATGLALGQTGTLVVECRAVRPNRELRYVHVEGHVVRDAGDRPKSVFGTVQDITERKRAEQLFSAQHAVTRLLAEASTLADTLPRSLQALCESLDWDIGALWQLDPRSGALRCAGFWRKLGAGARLLSRIARDDGWLSLDDELVGSIWSQQKAAFVPDVATVTGSLLAATASEAGLHGAFGFPVPLGSEVWGVFHFFSSEIRQPEHDLLAMTATLGSQIGQFVERKHSEAELQQARDQLAHVTRVATLGEMTASIAHEVNQPLTGIVTNAQAALRWLARDPPELGEAIETIQRLARDGKRAGDVVARLRALIRRGETTQKTSVDVNQIVRETLPLLRSEIQKNEVAVELDLSSGLSSASGDRVQVQQVLLNLLMNALEAMATIQDRPRRLIVRSADHDAHSLVISVHDTGTGLHPERSSQIFDAFFTTKPQGMGMGLAISRSIVEDHGGRLSAVSWLDQGSTFQFTLPKEPR